jgi:hypothetical protein
MKAINDTFLTIARGGMEISWRYAWALFLTQLAIRRQFSLAAAVCAFLIAAGLTQLAAGRNWRVYQRYLLQIAGFIPLALLAVHAIQYQVLPFFSLGWIGHLLLDAKSISQWLILILTLFCLWLIWRGGRILVKSSRRYSPVCMHFDKGLGLFFLLLITRAFVESRVGISLPGRDIVFLAIAYLVFSLTSISIARNQSNVQKSFLSGHHGMGVILSISTLVALLGTGTILLVYPYLYNVADSLFTATKVVAQPVDSALIKTLLFLFRPRERSLQPDASPTDAPKLTDMDNAPNLTDTATPAAEGWGALIQQIMGWGLLGIIGMVFLSAFGALLIYILRLLLKRSRDDMAQPLSTGWVSVLLREFIALPLLMWRRLVSLIRGTDCAAIVFAGMLRWGRWSGMIRIHSETPAEYGNRLTICFPALRADIELIVDAFNREVYRQTTTDRDTLSRLCLALRRMKRLRHWPSRIKVWFFQ